MSKSSNEYPGLLYPSLKRKSSATRSLGATPGLRLTLYPPKPRSTSSFKSLLRFICWLLFAWLTFRTIKLAARQVRIVYSHWRHIPVEVLDKCTDVEWRFIDADTSASASGSATALFRIPAGEPLFLVSQGNLSYGTVEFLANPDSAASVTEVEVAVYYPVVGLLDSARVCSLEPEPHEKADGEIERHGIMFYTPERSIVPPREEQLRFHVKVLLPSTPGARAYLPSLTTDLPTFAHKVGDLASSHTFDYFHLQTLESIHVDSLNAELISMQTYNQSISGSMTSWSSVHLETSNAAINANITLTTHPDLHSKHTELFMKTSNAALISTITLDPVTSSSPDTFKLTTKTTNGPLMIAFPPAPNTPPPNSNSTTHFTSGPIPPILRFDGQTTHAPALVSLPPTYAGLFALRSTETHPRLISKDPEGRTVVSKILEGGNLLKGRIYPREGDVAGKRTANAGMHVGAVSPPAWVNVRTTGDRVEVWL